MKTNRTNEESINEVKNLIKKHGSIQKTVLIKLTRLHSTHLDNILEELSKKGTILTAKIQTFSGDKVITQSFEIKWIRKTKK